MKPVSYFSFAQKLQRAINRLPKDDVHAVTVNSAAGVYRIIAEDIYYIESEGHNLIFHTKGGDYRERGIIILVILIVFIVVLIFRCTSESRIKRRRKQEEEERRKREEEIERMTTAEIEAELRAVMEQERLRKEQEQRAKAEAERAAEEARIMEEKAHETERLIDELEKERQERLASKK